MTAKQSDSQYRVAALLEELADIVRHEKGYFPRVELTHEETDRAVQDLYTLAGQWRSRAHCNRSMETKEISSGQGPAH